jgi:alkanesulfonate monooxygenase SsuD/methylene tetrahydromethanopterin reductase-like flavin-dependent oxidoreductase (luciferase family)
MTYIAGKYSNELQIADVWDARYLQLLESKFSAGRADAQNAQPKNISIGGICCISDDERACREKVKHTLSIYLPYLTRILEKTETPIDYDRLKQIEVFSKDGNYKKASELITDDMINTLTLTGSPEFAIEKINAGLKAAKANSILFSAPFGPDQDIKKNLKLIAQRVMPFLER